MRSERYGARRSCGVGMVEILVALLLISFGFLAAARMQVEGMRFTQSAYYHSQAYFLASEMADRMRANAEGLVAGDYDGLSLSKNASDPGCATRSCSAEEIARQDVYDWSAAVFSLGVSGLAPGALPDDADVPPTGLITALGDGEYQIRMTWPEVVQGETVVEPLVIRFTGQRR